MTSGEAQQHWSLPSDPGSARLARDHVAGQCAGYDTDVRDVVLLLTSELVSNAVEHGSGDVEVFWFTHPECLRVEVHDHSPVPPMPRGADPDSIRGRGLLLVQQLASEWGVGSSSFPGGKQVWFQLRVPPGS